MERLTWVDEDGTVLFQNPNQFPEDVAFTITELAKNEEYDFLERIAERLANREVAADYYKLKYEKKCAELAAERQEYRWIPVEEKLPNKSGAYIVTARDGDLTHVTFCKWQTRYKRWDLTGGRAYWKVIAWQPLPEPYQQEKGGAAG